MKKQLSAQEELDLSEIIGQSQLPRTAQGHPFELDYPKFTAAMRELGEPATFVAIDFARAGVHVREFEYGRRPLMLELHKLYWPVETADISAKMKEAIEAYHYRTAAERAAKFRAAMDELPENREKRRLREAKALDRAMLEAERRMAREARAARKEREAARAAEKNARIAQERADAKAAREAREARRLKAEQEKRTRTMWRFIALGADERVARLAVAACVPVSREALEAFKKTLA